jgi:hypothetical protein
MCSRYGPGMNEIVASVRRTNQMLMTLPLALTTNGLTGEITVPVYRRDFVTNSADQWSQRSHSLLLAKLNRTFAYFLQCNVIE